jgi:hypothetical protein
VPRGFGAAAGLAGDQGIEVTPGDLKISENPMGNMAQDIHAIRERYDQPTSIDSVTFNLLTGVTSKLDRSMTTLTSVMISVITGTVNFWFGDFTTVSGGTPHAQFTATGQPFQMVLPPQGYIFTFQADGGAADFTVHLMAL